jgi:tetratricopeptide (TPR) repeat protein
MNRFLRHLPLAVVAFSLTLSTPVVADVNTDANALFVGAVKAWNAAAAIPADDTAQAADRLTLLEEVNGNLDRILDELPGSDLAVRLITGETLGPITLAGARAALVQISAVADAQTCAAAPDPTCLMQQALVIALAEPDELYRDSLLSDVASGMAQSGDPDAAIAIGGEYADPMMQIFISGEIMYALARAGRIDEAMAIAGDDLSDRDRAIIAHGLAEGGHQDKAELIIATITDPASLAYALAATGHVAEAQLMVPDFSDVERAGAMPQIAIALARAGQIDAATEAFYQIAATSSRFEPRRELAMAQMRAGLVDDAVKTTEGMAQPSARLALLLSLWRIAGDEKVAAEVLRLLDKLPEGSSARFLPLTAMSMIDPAGGYAEEATTIRSAITDIEKRRGADYFVVNAAIALERYTEAAAAVEMIVPDNQRGSSDRIHALSDIAIAMAAEVNAP